MKRGVPPTAVNARTGELTPPGVTANARAYKARELVSPAAFAGSVAATSREGTTESFKEANGSRRRRQWLSPRPRPTIERGRGARPGMNNRRTDQDARA